MDRATVVNRYLKNYDRNLYCSRNREGKLCVYRNSYRYDKYSLDNETDILVARSNPFFIMALTHDWSWKGVAADWGYLPLMQKLKSIDNWNRDVVEEVIEHNEKIDAKEKRDRMNKTEDFMYEFRDQFKKTFKDVNVSNLSKKTDLRYLKDKQIKGDL